MPKPRPGPRAGMTPGWMAGPGAVVSAEEVRDHLGEIRSEEGYTVPENIGAEMGIVAAAFKAAQEGKG